MWQWPHRFTSPRDVAVTLTCVNTLCDLWWGNCLVTQFSGCTLVVKQCTTTHHFLAVSMEQFQVARAYKNSFSSWNNRMTPISWELHSSISHHREREETHVHITFSKLYCHTVMLNSQGWSSVLRDVSLGDFHVTWGSQTALTQTEVTTTMSLGNLVSWDHCCVCDWSWWPRYCLVHICINHGVVQHLIINLLNKNNDVFTYKWPLSREVGDF